jgi:hypothetical protein
VLDEVVDFDDVHAPMVALAPLLAHRRNGEIRAAGRLAERSTDRWMLEPQLTREPIGLLLVP